MTDFVSRNLKNYKVIVRYTRVTIKFSSEHLYAFAFRISHFAISFVNL